MDQQQQQQQHQVQATYQNARWGQGPVAAAPVDMQLLSPNFLPAQFVQMYGFPPPVMSQSTGVGVPTPNMMTNFSTDSTPVANAGVLMPAANASSSAENSTAMNLSFLSATDSAQQFALLAASVGGDIPPVAPQDNTALPWSSMNTLPTHFPLPPTPAVKGKKEKTSTKTEAPNLTTTSKKDGTIRPPPCNLTPAEKAKMNRDRNREHARSTRLRKKAYVNQLKEMVENLHSERTEEARKKKVAMQHLAEVKEVRRAVIRNFLKFQTTNVSDPRKWSTLLEDQFWFKQPVTPYRSFRREEIEKECRVSRGVDAMISDAASVAVMIEDIGSRSSRWIQTKRDDFFLREDRKNGENQNMPRNIGFQHAVSSLSSSSGSSGNGSGGEDERRQARRQQKLQSAQTGLRKDLVSGSSERYSSTKIADGASAKIGSSINSGRISNQKPSNDFHDYNAPSLPDPLLDGSSAGSDSPAESQFGSDGAASGGKNESSSSGDEESCQNPSAPKKLKSKTNGTSLPGKSDATMVSSVQSSRLPPNIAKSGGISHSIRPVSEAGSVHGTKRKLGLSMAPAIPLPPFAGIGKRSRIGGGSVASAGVTITSAPKLNNSIGAPPKTSHLIGAGNVLRSEGSLSATSNGVVSRKGADNETSSSQSSSQIIQTQAYYHINEDDIILTDDVLMCPFIFRSQDAVLSGALAECTMPGMLRAHFSPRNKLQSLEMVYDAMGFMQQLERAGGSEGECQIVPNSLEMALSPTTKEARVITLAKSPFLIVSVNEPWTRMTKYTQVEVEGKELLSILPEKQSGGASVAKKAPGHKFDEVTLGRCTSSVTLHYDKNGNEVVDYIRSYPLTNANDDITHILHVFQDLPPPSSSDHEFQDTQHNRSISFQQKC